jgi:hypothetical protein
MLLALLVSVAVLVPSYEIEPYPGPRLMRVHPVYRELGLDRVQANILISRRRTEYNHIQVFPNPTTRSQADRHRAVKKILSDLDPQIRGRLGEVYLQIYQETAALDPHVQTLLSLSKRQIAIVQSEHNGAILWLQAEHAKTAARLQKLRPPGPHETTSTKNPSPPLAAEQRRAYDEEIKRMDQVWRDALAKARRRSASVLTQTQRAKLNKMKGRPMSELPKLRGPYFAANAILGQLSYP